MLHVERPRSLWDSVGAHFPAALVTGILLLLAIFAPLDRMPIPTCTFLQWTGYPCPFCGSTRAFMDMAQGRYVEAFSGHPWASVLYLLTALVFAWNCAALLGGVVLKKGRLLKPPRAIRAALWALLAAALLATWFYRLAMGLK
ncbi:MAG: hypothetical protein A2X46_06790 [Lentisphaerae bacterium GWF2_57_35]|nr:MAG: hypothetical protein A2X46_06790 [Lentisphaerae bacterium GWF2_57_35]